MRKQTKEDFIDKSKTKHGDKYDYSLVDYVNVRTKVKIICGEHGVFEQPPNSHLLGKGCALCGIARQASKVAEALSMGTDEFIRRSNDKHDNAYDYSGIEYINSRQLVTIKCQVHGGFEVRTYDHLNGSGCPACSAINPEKRTTAKGAAITFIDKAKIAHNNIYDYSKVVYKSATAKVIVNCMKHGDFLISPYNHLVGSGCQSCSKEKASMSLRGDTQSFINKAVITHGDKYDYRFVDYSSSTDPVKIVCPVHGEFHQRPDNHVTGKGCRKCGMQMSKGEDEIFSLVSSICSDAIQSDRKTITPYELDIVIPSRALAIEFNGVWWHGDDKKDKKYHRNKFLACAEKGIRLISITDIEWQNRKEQLTSIIKSALGARDSAPVNARQCVVEEITPSESKEFLDKWHVQGNTTAKKIAIGLRTKDGELVSVMTFSKGANYRGNAKLAADELPWSLSRYATSRTVRGGAGKLFKYAVREYGMKVVESFSMNNFFGGAIYSTLGFEKVHDVPVDYQVYHPKSGLRPKSHWQRRVIPQRLIECGMESIDFNPDKAIDSRTEFEIEDLCGAKRIWDTGKVLWRWVAE